MSFYTYVWYVSMSSFYCVGKFCSVLINLKLLQKITNSLKGTPDPANNEQLHAQITWMTFQFLLLELKNS